MGHIVLNSWKMGLQKVSLTKLQMYLLKKGLVESKKNVDELLDGKIVLIEENDGQIAHEFISEAQKIGVICYYSEEGI